jgi:hypothetical protein
MGEEVGVPAETGSVQARHGKRYQRDFTHWQIRHYTYY